MKMREKLGDQITWQSPSQLTALDNTCTTGAPRHVKVCETHEEPGETLNSLITPDHMEQCAQICRRFNVEYADIFKLYPVLATAQACVISGI